MMRAGREARCHIEFRMLTIWEPLLYNINRIYSRSPQLQVRSGLLVCNREAHVEIAIRDPRNRSCLTPRGSVGRALCSSSPI